MMTLRGGLNKCQPGVRFTPTRSLAKSKNECPSNLLATKSKAVSCPHTTSRMTKLAAESAKAEKTSGFLSKRWSNSKKCPKFCSYMDRQCPPLIPPIVKPKLPVVKDAKGQPETKMPQLQRLPPRSDVPFAAVMAYRLVVFGAKLGVAGYCVKWTIDNGVWGHSKGTSEMWEKISSRLYHNIPQFSVLSGGSSETPHTLTQCWNGAVITLFDAMVDASRWVKRKAVEKERQAYGLPPLELADEGATFVSLKSRLDGWTERWGLAGKEGEDDTIQPGSPEYYGTKPGSAITEEDEQQDQQTQETQIDLQSLEIPDFQLDLLITTPTLEHDLSPKPAVERECKSKQTKAEAQDGSAATDSNLESDDIKGDELIEVAVKIRCHCDSDILLTTEGSPCSHPQCPLTVKHEESTQQLTTETN